MQVLVLVLVLVLLLLLVLRRILTAAVGVVVIVEQRGAKGRRLKVILWAKAQEQVLGGKKSLSPSH
jgi:hypothetical protein